MEILLVFFLCVFAPLHFKKEKLREDVDKNFSFYSQRFSLKETSWSAKIQNNYNSKVLQQSNSSPELRHTKISKVNLMKTTKTITIGPRKVYAIFLSKKIHHAMIFEIKYLKLHLFDNEP